MRTLGRLLIFAIAAVLAACSLGTSTSGQPSSALTPGPSTAFVEVTPAATTKATSDLAHPVGVIAIGHSGLTGEGTSSTSQAAPENSWATGTNLDVESIYLRLVEAVPDTQGHRQNQASGGAPASTLVAQAKAALAAEPAPRLAIVQTVDNDITCPASNVEQVGAQVAAALELIHDSSPNTKILVVGQAGRPSVDFVETLVAHDASQKAHLTGDDSCAFYTPDGKINPSGFAKLTAAIDAYEAETARVCALVPNCVTDAGVRRTWVDKLEYFAPDYNHLNVAGQAAVAAQLWPVVKDLLQL
jgi:hypothetical protein